MIGELPGFRTVWYHADGISNVISLGLVTATHRVTMDSTLDNVLYIHKPDVTYCRFGKSESNLYYCNMRDTEGTLLTIETVKGEKGMFSAIDVKRADHARKFQDTVGFPSTKGLLDMIDNCVIKNIPISRRDV